MSAARQSRSHRRAQFLSVALAALVTVAVAPSAAALTPGHRAQGVHSPRVETLLAAMTLEEKVGQLFVSRIYGDEANETNASQVRRNRAEVGVANAAELIARYRVGGVIYFRWAGNLESVRRTAQLSNGIQSEAMKRPRGVPLLISTDQEGGVITRLPYPATTFAGNMALGATRRTDLARGVGRVIGRELAAVGINQALAPVADVNVNPANPVIGVRSFGSSAAMVADMTAAQVRGLQEDAGVAATPKHFPGHGDTDTDSHTGLPIIDVSRATWETHHRPPFSAAIAAGTEVIMTAHVAVPALDPSGRPATLSRPILTGVLRDEMGFDGVIMTDSLGMAAVKRLYGNERTPVMALQAGADMLLNPPSLPVAYRAVMQAIADGKLTVSRIDESVRRILRMKERLGLLDSWHVDVARAGSIVGAASHRQLERQVALASVTLLRNRGNVLPLRRPGRVLLTGWSDAALGTIQSELRTRGISSTRRVTGSAPSASAISAVASQAAAHDVVVVITGNADSPSYASQRRLVRRLMETGKPVVTIAARRPYDIAWYDASVHLALYSATQASMRAAVQVMLGEASPVGRLPVGVRRPGGPPVHPYGFGLGYD